MLVGFGLLAQHPALRQRYCADVPYGTEFDTAAIAVFNGRNNPLQFLG
ncbi:hypothetical protein [Chloroflexus aggregans]|nr:hypothetical protein [Chloroflexus aggregans]